MKFFRSFKFTVLQNQRWVKFRYDAPVSYYYRKWPPAIALYSLFVLLFVAVIAHHNTPQLRQPDNGKGRFSFNSRLKLANGSLTLQTRAIHLGQGSSSSGGSNDTSAIAGALAVAHSGVTTTIFWVGEPADADNGFIANIASAWDGNWKQNFGGFDDPNNRNGYFPAAFTPKENPFYFALPYSDVTNSGTRKATAINCPLYASMKNQPYSWCKNSWIVIKHNGKTVYAQWEDVGPFEEDDTAYVFGSASPKNKQGSKAGLDVSPAVRDYLGLGDVDSCDWSFVTAGSVPAGAWTQVVSTDLGDSL